MSDIPDRTDTPRAEPATLATFLEACRRARASLDSGPQLVPLSDRGAKVHRLFGMVAEIIGQGADRRGLPQEPTAIWTYWQARELVDRLTAWASGLAVQAARPTPTVPPGNTAQSEVGRNRTEIAAVEGYAGTEQGEAIGTGRGAVQGQQGEAGKLKLGPARLKAYQQYRRAIERNSAIDGATDREVYDWVKQNLDDDEKLPAFPTWAKYLRDVRRVKGTSKHTSRAGRTGRSIVNPDQI